MTGHPARIQMYKHKMSLNPQLLQFPIFHLFPPMFFFASSPQWLLNASSFSLTLCTSEELQEILLLQKVKVNIMQKGEFLPSVMYYSNFSTFTAFFLKVIFFCNSHNQTVALSTALGQTSESPSRTLICSTIQIGTALNSFIICRDN